MKKQIVKTILKPFLLPVAIGIVAWEELAYKPIKAISNFLEKSQIIHKVSDKIRNANPYVALTILMCGALPLLPFKMAGLYLIGHGYKVLGIGTFGAAKIIGSGIGVHLFNLTEPSIRKIPFINSSLDWIFDKKDKIKHVLTESPAYIATKEMIHTAKSHVKEFIAKNEFIQTAKNLFKKKTVSKEPIVHIEKTVEVSIVTPELSIFERINTKVDVMSSSISEVIKQDTITVEKNTQKPSEFEKIAINTQITKPEEKSENKMKM